LPDHQLGRCFRAEAPFEAAVRGDVEFSIVERGFAVGHHLVGVLAAEQLEAHVRGGAALPGHDVIVLGQYPGSEVERVGVVEAHLGEWTRAAVQERMVPLVVKRDVRARRDAAREVLQAFQQIGFGFDVGGFGDQFLGLGDRLEQWLRIHALETRTRSNASQYIDRVGTYMERQGTLLECPPQSPQAARRRPPNAWSASSISSPAVGMSGSGCPSWPASWSCASRPALASSRRSPMPATWSETPATRPTGSVRH